MVCSSIVARDVCSHLGSSSKLCRLGSPDAPSERVGEAQIRQGPDLPLYVCASESLVRRVHRGARTAGRNMADPLIEERGGDKAGAGYPQSRVCGPRRAMEELELV